MMRIVPTTGLAFNINVWILVDCWIPVVKELFVRHHHTDLYVVVPLDGEEIHTISAFNVCFSHFPYFLTSSELR